MRAHFQYLKYVLRHKWFVFWACLKMGVPVHLAIWHDMSKFSRAEWSPYVHSFYNPDGSKRRGRQAVGACDPIKIRNDFSRAWHHHEKNNKHHWGYWVITSGSSEKNRFSIQRHGDGYPLFIFDNLLGVRMTPELTDDFGGSNYKDLQAIADRLSRIMPEPILMPEVYIREMIADWIGAGMAINGKSDPIEWYEKNKETFILHKETRLIIENLFRGLNHSR